MTNSLIPINKKILKCILEYDVVPSKLYRLYLEGIAGRPSYWDEENDRRIPYFGYDSITNLNLRVVISCFRIKALRTFILLPVDGQYKEFAKRCYYAQQKAG